MCRTVSDAVHVLDAIVGYDVLDAAATGAASKYIPNGGYTQFQKKDGLRGKRISVLNGFFQGYEHTQLNVYKQHLDTMRKHGAVVIENLNISINFTSDLGLNEGIAMQAEFKLSLNAYLADLVSSPVRSLAQVIAFNNAHPVEYSDGEVSSSTEYNHFCVGTFIGTAGGSRVKVRDFRQTPCTIRR